MAAAAALASAALVAASCFSHIDPPIPSNAPNPAFFFPLPFPAPSSPSSSSLESTSSLLFFRFLPAPFCIRSRSAPLYLAMPPRAQSGSLSDFGRTAEEEKRFSGSEPPEGEAAPSPDEAASESSSSSSSLCMLRPPPLRTGETEEERAALAAAEARRVEPGRGRGSDEGEFPSRRRRSAAGLSDSSEEEPRSSVAFAPDLAMCGGEGKGVSEGIANHGFDFDAQGLEGLALFERSLVAVGAATLAAPGLRPAAAIDVDVVATVAFPAPGSLGALALFFVVVLLWVLFLARAKKSSASSEDEFLAAFEAGWAAAAAAAAVGREEEALVRRLVDDEEGFGRMFPPPPPAGAGDRDVDGAVLARSLAVE